MKHIIAIIIVILLTGITLAEAQPHRDNRDWCQENSINCRSRLGGKCGKGQGDCYGARRRVTSPVEARERLEQFFAGQELTVSEVTDKPWRYEAIIKNQHGAVVDRVMIDKRSGRIRSLF